MERVVIRATVPRPLARQRNVVLAILLAVAAACWVVVVLEARGAGGMAHGGLDLTMGMRAPLFVGMWTVMMAAMMFPAAAPMILMYTTLQARNREAGRPYVPASIFVGAYLVVWTVFGGLAFALAEGVEHASVAWGWLMPSWPRIVGALLVAAGLYQLSPLKEVCLGKCRTPFAFLLSFWRDGRWGAFTMGLRHGLYCLGCCWMLFVILIPLGVMNLAAMVAVGLVVFAEKTMPGARMIARATAVALVGYGAAVLAWPAALPT